VTDSICTWYFCIQRWITSLGHARSWTRFFAAAWLRSL